LPPEWKGFVRVFIVLTIIDRLSLFSQFLEQGIADTNLPYDHMALNALEIFSSHPSICLDFHDAQRKLFHPIEYFERKIKKSGTLREDEWKSSLDEKSRIWGTDRDKVQVLKVLHKKDPTKESALKLIKGTMQTDDRRERAVRELTILQRIEHANIVRLIGSFRAPDSVGILILPVANQNLEEYLRKDPMDREAQRVLTGSFGCLIDAVCYLHHEGYVRHDDLKPQNILVKGDRVLITDFDISLDWKETRQSTTPGSNGWTERYRSPEVMESRPVRSSSDIWSLGCVFLEVATVLKGLGMERLHGYLKQREIKWYSQDLYITRGWIDAHLRKTGLDKVGDEPLVWTSHMIKYPPEKRMSAWQLRELVRDKWKDEVSGFLYHGPCCTTKAEESHGKTQVVIRSGVPPVEEASERARADQNTAVAVTGWSDEHVSTLHPQIEHRWRAYQLIIWQRIYFQG
jgi:serine/threonine protein kinase